MNVSNSAINIKVDRMVISLSGVCGSDDWMAMRCHSRFTGGFSSSNNVFVIVKLMNEYSISGSSSSSGSGRGWASAETKKTHQVHF